MEDKWFNILPTVVCILLLVGLVACGTSQKMMEEAPPQVEQADTVKEFIPLHPPVVIRRSQN